MSWRFFDFSRDVPRETLGLRAHQQEDPGGKESKKTSWGVLGMSPFTVKKSVASNFWKNQQKIPMNNTSCFLNFLGAGDAETHAAAPRPLRSPIPAQK